MKKKKSLDFSIETFDEKINTFYYNFIHNKLPLIIRSKCSEIFYVSKIIFISRLKHLQLSTYYIQGRDKINGLELNVVIFGDKLTLKYICKLLSLDDYKIEEHGKTFIWSIDKKLNKLNRSVDAVFVRTDRFFSRRLQNKKFMILPEWVGMKLDISGSLENIYKKFKKSAKDDVRIVKKRGYSYEISADLEKFVFFYHNICLPYTFKRHGELAQYASTHRPEINEIKSMFEKGRLLLVKERDKIVSGVIMTIIHSSKTAYLMYSGVDIKDNYLSKAAGAASYYFVIKWAKEQGFRFLNFGGARPFFNDGLFKYKTKWGMTLDISKRSFGIFGFKICNYKNKAVIDFLEQNPFIYLKEDKLKGMILVKEELDKNGVQEIWKKYNTCGLSGLTIISSHKIDENIKSHVASNYENKIILKENLRLF